MSYADNVKNDDRAWLFYNPADYALLVRLADYCEARGMSEEQFDELYAAVIENDSVAELVFNLVCDVHGKLPNTEANEARKESAEADAGSIKELYKFLTEDEGKSRTEAIAELELSLNFSNSKINAAIKDIADGKRDEREARKRWIWWDYGPCFAEHKGNKSATYKELADRHGLSVSTIKRICRDSHHLANFMINEHPNHSWVPNERTYNIKLNGERGMIWGGRLGDLCRDYRKALHEVVRTRETYFEIEDDLSCRPELLENILITLGEKYGFRLDQVKILLKIYPRKLLAIDWGKEEEEGSFERLSKRYGLKHREIKYLLYEAGDIEEDKEYYFESGGEVTEASELNLWPDEDVESFRQKVLGDEENEIDDDDD